MRTLFPLMYFAPLACRSLSLPQMTYNIPWEKLNLLKPLTIYHVFLCLLQGPHIASVTLAAYECGSTDFPEPPYPDQIICPPGGGVDGSITLWSIVSKVRLEACMWVSGTVREKRWSALKKLINR